VTFVHRVRAFLKTRRRARLMELPARQASDYKLTDSVLGADRVPSGGWREVGKSGSIFD
jgi:hypothetical protein